MGMSKAMRQMLERSGRAGVTHGEAGRELASDEACGPPREHPDTGSARPKVGAGTLLEAALTRENLQAAWRRVKSNRGAAGVDRLGIEQTAQLMRTNWPQIRQALLAGTYRPQPVRGVMIPKPDGSQRELGIPTVLDRLIQQALLQVLQPLIDPAFSDHSHGFRPGRRAHDAVKAARAYVQTGKRVVVDVDLAKFFDRVNHDILIDRLGKRIDDAGVIRLVRAYLNAGIMDGGVVVERHLGTPQGGPITPCTQKVTSSLSGISRCAGRFRCLTYDARSNMFVSNVAIQRRREGPTLERCIRSAHPRPRCRAGRGGADRGIRLVWTASLSLLAAGPGAQASGAGLGTQRSHHRQGARGHRHEAARARACHGFDDRRRGLACCLGIAGSGAPAWLSAARAAQSASSIASIVCSAPSSNRSTTSWFQIAPAAPAGPAE
jgi:hypothetical protein